MYVVRNKKTKEVIHMMNSTPDEELKPEQVLPHFDAKTMELGRFEHQYLPAEFTIKDGVVKEVGKESAPNLKELKALKLAAVGRQSFQQRQQLIPDHEMMNAALGIYPEKRTKQIQETVRAFRDEYKRFEAALEKAKSKKDIEDLEPKFPTKLQG